MKKQVEQLYINAVYEDEAPSNFAVKILDLFGIDWKEKRTSEQNKSRWKYLSMVASILNKNGFTYDAIGIDIPIKYNKDILYCVYWQTSRSVLFPLKKGQLNTREFCQLVDHVMDLFSIIFDIHIAFPNREDYEMSKQFTK